MRLVSIFVVLVVLAGVGACGGRGPASAVLSEPGPGAAPVSVPAPLELAIVDAGGAQRIERWTEQLEIPKSTEDVGVFAYAQRRTVLRSDGDGVAVGWLEPGARVGVTKATRDRVEVMLFAWHASSLDGNVRVWVDARDLGPSPPRDAPPFSHATRAERQIMHGQYLNRLDGARLGFTFCGAVEVIGDEARGLHVVQREDGVALEGTLERNASWADRACAGLLVVEDYKQRPQLVYHDRWRAYRGAALPAGLVESGPFEGPTFAQLVAKRAQVYWLVEERDRGAACEAWQLVPPARGSDDGELVSRMKLDDGDTLVVHFGLMYGTEADATVTLLGPHSEVIARPGRQPQSAGLSFGCGMEYRIVASTGGVLTMHAAPPGLASHIRAYDPHDTERWYTERAVCERDAEARRRRVALAFEPHHGC